MLTLYWRISSGWRATSRLTSSLDISRWYLLVVDHSSTVLVESLLALGSKVLRVSASDVVNGKENIGYHCGLGITYLGKPGVGGTRMSSSLRLQLFYNGEPCAGIHYLCIMTASPESSSMQKYMYPRRRIRKTSFRAPSFDN